MPPQIPVSDDLFRRLQAQAIPFVDHTPASVIERLLDSIESKNGAGVTFAPKPEPLARRFDPARAPDLTHTRVRGSFGSADFSTWNDLVQTAHIQAFAKAKTFEELRKATLAQIQRGSYSEKGYRFIPGIDTSVQGVDANRAWEYSFKLAKYLQTPIQAYVEWRNNEKAAYPGESAVLEWTP